MRQDSGRLLQTYLRRGIPGEAQVRIRIGSSALELKFNPYHDPRNGRFTFAPGGGSFGGAGATGSYPDPEPVSKSPQAGGPLKKAGPSPMKPQSANRGHVAIKPATSSDWQHISKNGYEFQIDETGRTREAGGELTLNKDQIRSRSAQAKAGGEDRRPSDHGGHYIARQFNGPTEAFNHFAQDANFNRSAYKQLENSWETAIRNGQSVRVTISPEYEGSSQRPSFINVQYVIDGKLRLKRFPNLPKAR